MKLIQTILFSTITAKGKYELQIRNCVYLVRNRNQKLTRLLSFSERGRQLYICGGGVWLTKFEFRMACLCLNAFRTVKSTINSIFNIHSKDT